jgi:hypothetical protein
MQQPSHAKRKNVPQPAIVARQAPAAEQFARKLQNLLSSPGGVEQKSEAKEQQQSTGGCILP